MLWSKGANVSIPAKRGKVQDTSVIMMVIISIFDLGLEQIRHHRVIQKLFTSGYN